MEEKRRLLLEHEAKNVKAPEKKIMVTARLIEKELGKRKSKLMMRKQISWDSLWCLILVNYVLPWKRTGLIIMNPGKKKFHAVN